VETLLANEAKFGEKLIAQAVLHGRKAAASTHALLQLNILQTVVFSDHNTTPSQDGGAVCKETYAGGFRMRPGVPV
jgi:hypothetical protein